MTMYEVQCRKCGHKFQTDKNPDAPTLTDRPKCKCNRYSTVLVSSVPIVLSVAAPPPVASAVPTAVVSDTTTEETPPSEVPEDKIKRIRDNLEKRKHEKYKRNG